MYYRNIYIYLFIYIYIYLFIYIYSVNIKRNTLFSSMCHNWPICYVNSVYHISLNSIQYNKVIFQYKCNWFTSFRLYEMRKSIHVFSIWQPISAYSSSFLSPTHPRSRRPFLVVVGYRNLQCAECHGIPMRSAQKQQHRKVCHRYQRSCDKFSLIGNDRCAAMEW